MKPTILFLFNSSTYAMAPWLDDGRFNVVTVDYSDTDHADTERGDRDTRAFYMSQDLSHQYAADIVADWLYSRGLAQPSLVVSFAPCTDLAVSGAKHFQKKLERDPECQNRAVRMAKLAAEFGCPYAVENPVSRLATLWRRPNHYWHPWHYSGYIHRDNAEHPEFPGIIPPRDRYNKKSCLWTGKGFKLPSENATGPAPVDSDNPGWAKLGGKSARTKHIRSLTPRGFAKALYLANCDEILSKKGLTNQLDFPMLTTG